METAPKHRESWKEFLKRKQINFTVQTYFIDALGPWPSAFSPPS